MSIAAIVSLFGIDMAYARFFLMGDKGNCAQVERFCWRFAASGAIVTALLSFGFLYWLGGRWLEDNQALAVYTAVAILLTVFVTMAATRRRLLGNYRRVALALFGSAVFSAIASIVIAVTWRPDAWSLLLGIAAGSVIAILINGMPNGMVLLSPSKLPRFRKREIFYLGLAGSVTAPLYWLISSVDRWFIADYWGASEVGIYSMAASVAALGLMLNSAVTMTWFPEVSRAYGERGRECLTDIGRVWSRLVVGLALMWLAVSAAGGDVLRLLAAPSFHEGAQYVPWLAGGMFFYGLASLSNTTLFLDAKMHLAAYVWIVGGVACIALNFALVPWLGALGGALAQCLAFTVPALGVLFVSQRVLPMVIDWRCLAVALPLVLVAGLVMSPPWQAHALFSLFSKFPVGVLVSLVLVRLAAPDWYRQFLDLSMKRLFGKAT